MEEERVHLRTLWYSGVPHKSGYQRKIQPGSGCYLSQTQCHLSWELVRVLFTPSIQMFYHSFLKHFFTLQNPNRLCCYEENECRVCVFIVFVQVEGIHSYRFLILRSSANSQCCLFLSSVCLPLSSHFPPPAPPVSLQSLLCNLSASHSPDPALPSSELKPDRCWGLMF